MKNNYRPSLLFKNAHLNTIVPNLKRKIERINYEREAFKIKEDLFIYLDWVKNNSNKLVIISHGLEGNSRAKHVLGMAKIFSDKSYDILSWNNRGCASGESHSSMDLYHSGLTDDLAMIIEKVSKMDQYEEISLIGFSLGGNLTLKYLGERNNIEQKIKRACAISTPIDLKGSSDELLLKKNILYQKFFMKSVRKKIGKYKEDYEKLGINIDSVLASKDLREFDDRFIAKFFGFKDCFDYYQKSSSIQFLNNIKIPTLLFSALDDPFLSDSCYPSAEKLENKLISTLYPKYGGHVGFFSNEDGNHIWSEKTVLEFITST